MKDELLDLVDENDQVIGTVMKSVAHAENKRIRIIHVFIFDTQGRMAVQLRSESVNFAPGHWVTAGSGHVAAGETYEQAGARELQEELGISVPLTFEGTERYQYVDGTEEFLGVMRGQYDGEFVVHPEDVARVAWFTMDDLQNMIRRGEKIHPEFLFLLIKRFGLTPRR